MKRSLYAMVAVTLFAAGAGCHRHHLRNDCATCGPGGGAAYGGDCEYGDECGYGDGGGGRHRGGGLFGHHRNGGGGGGLMGHHAARNQFTPGPPTSTVAYPYYTVRGPRDFFCDKPSSVGPY